MQIPVSPSATMNEINTQKKMQILNILFGPDVKKALITLQFDVFFLCRFEQLGTYDTNS